MAIITTNLPRTYRDTDCIEIQFEANDLDGIMEYANVKFTFYGSFINIANGLQFTFFNQVYETGQDDGMLDLSSSSVETNTQAFADFIYSIFEFHDLFLPPPPSEDTWEYDSAIGNGFVEIQWLSPGVVEGFNFDVSNLSGASASTQNEGADWDGKESYKIVYRLFEGLYPVTGTMALPMISLEPAIIPSIDIGVITKNLVGTMDIAPILSNTPYVVDDLMYKEFYLRFGSSWNTEDSCETQFSPFEKSELIIVTKNDTTLPAAIIHPYSLTKSCKFSNLMIWVKGAITSIRFDFEINDNGSYLDPPIPFEYYYSVFSQESVTAFQIGFNLWAQDVNLYLSSIGHNIEELTSYQVLFMVGAAEIGRHQVLLSDCACCTAIHFELENGGWVNYCLTPTSESEEIVRSEMCLFGCGETTMSSVYSITKEIEYTAPNHVIMDLARSPRVYYNYQGKLYPIRVKQGKFVKDETTKITLIE